MPDTPSRLPRHTPALAMLGLAAIVVGLGLDTRSSRAEQLQQDAEKHSIRSVTVISPTPVEGTLLELPGRIEAWSRAPIHARVSGYLSRWNVDIGAPVKAGQVLAEIETPDLDQELRQARAELQRARAEAALADTTAQRWQSLLASNAVSQQEVAERTGEQASRRAAVNGLQANVERVQALQRFKQLVAPFDGIVTARNTDVGALINVGMTPGSELFEICDVRRLRVYVNVPQRQLATIRTGTVATLSVPERPGKTWTATVQSLSQAIDADSGSMRVQLTVDNSAAELLPGAYATVNFAATGAGGLGLPASALIFGRNGVQVAVVDAQGQARLKPVSITRDLGRVIELGQGVASDDRVIDSPPDGVGDGDRVRVIEG
ncbi:efflux RND transporter periplasmic adaptor subunit [Pseudomonas sp. 3A(2025)]